MCAGVARLGGPKNELGSHCHDLCCVSAVGGLFATFAAFRAAGLARSALEHSRSIEQRRTCDALVDIAQEIKAEHAVVNSLTGKLETETRDHAGLTNTVHRSWLPQKLESLRATRESLATIEERATEWASNYRGLLALDGQEVTDLRAKLLARPCSPPRHTRGFAGSADRCQGSKPVAEGEGAVTTSGGKWIGT